MAEAALSPALAAGRPARRRLGPPLLTAAALAVLVVLPFAINDYYVTLLTRMLIFGLAALSVNLLLGYGGLVSFGHAAFVGIGAYSSGILAQNGVESAFLAWPLTILAGAAAATLIGAVALRTAGLYFIMITLALAQMVFHLFRSLRQYGGDDGFALIRNDFAGLLELYDPLTFYFVVLVLLVLVVALFARIMAAPFGELLQCSRDDAGWVEALGLRVYPYRLAAFALSGAVAALAGLLLANLDGYITPALAGWHLSGELLVMVILGGVGSLAGPVVGAVLYLSLAEGLGHLTDHWMVILGPLLVLRVLLLRDGLYDWIKGRLSRG